MRARRRGRLSPLKHLIQMGVDSLYEIWIVLLRCNRKGPAFGLNGFSRFAQVGVDPPEKMQRQSIPSA